MVYCPKCGTKNEEMTQFCINCGANLQTGTEASRQYERRKAQQECFGLPNGGLVAAIVIGLLILLWGVYLILEQTGTITANVPFWIVLVITLGILMIAGAVYQITHRRGNP